MDLLDVSGKVSDLFSMSWYNGSYRGYVPPGLGVGEGDYFELAFCLACGKIQGKFPKSKANLPKEEGDDEEE